MRRQSYNTTHQVRARGVDSVVYGLNDDALIYSENHTRDKNGVWTGGGPFMTYHLRYAPTVVGPYMWRYGGDYSFKPYVGFARPGPEAPQTSAQLQQTYTSEYNNAWAFGATGWKRARPGNPVAGAAQFVGELREGLPRIPFRLYNRLRDLLQKKATHRRIHGSNLGDEYLNVAFGWLPLISDIRKMYELTVTLDKRLAQIVKDNGKGVHRRREIRNSDVTTTSISAANLAFWGWGSGPDNIVQGYGSVETVTQEVDKIWFVGKFRYYIPDIGSNEWRRKTIRALYGANFTPEVAYNLIPWTWLFDWFGNMGDVMSNASSNAVDNLTADYAYVMRTIEKTVTYHGFSRWSDFLGDPVNGKYIQGGSVYASATAYRGLKIRTVGSPFGFGATFDGLSNYQLGIAAALGISRWR
jgi:hypothetical protein